MGAVSAQSGGVYVAGKLIRPLTILGIALLAASTLSWGKLKPIDEDTMSDVVAQAYISIDKHFNPIAGDNTSYTRVNFGLDIETQLNADVLELGRYQRTDDPNAPADSADVLINDFALGFIYNEDYFRNNPSMPRPLKPDGSSYRDGEIVPFKITDPFIEFAMDEGTNELTGFRIGFGQAEGYLSGDVQYLTGNVNVDIRDNGSGMKAASSSSNNLLDRIVVALAPLLTANSPLYTNAKLVDQQGNPDNIRAQYIGIPNGDVFYLYDVDATTRYILYQAAEQLGVLSNDMVVHGCSGTVILAWCGWAWEKDTVEIKPNNCQMLGVSVCFDLGMYKSLPIGQVEKRNGKKYLTGPSSGMFLSFQTKDLQWLNDVRKENPNDADFIKATSGAFFNIPNSVIEVDLNQALKGTPRVRTEYIDRGRGLF